MNWNLLVVIAVPIAYLVGVVILLPYVLAAICLLRPGKDDPGPPPPSGHGWITRKD